MMRGTLCLSALPCNLCGVLTLPCFMLRTPRMRNENTTHEICTAAQLYISQLACRS